jgi:hypothetical protein
MEIEIGSFVDFFVGPILRGGYNGFACPALCKASWIGLHNWRKGLGFRV